MNGVVLGGTSSGVGKTVATLTVIRALRREGYEVQPAKAGPDFIDPSHHEAIADRPSRTLDLWLEGEDGLHRNYYRGEGDLTVVEGVMGLYDGDGSSTAMVAEALSLPVVLVADAKAGMESIAATALGFREYADRIGREIDVAGVLVQRAHGGRHEQGIRDALPEDLEYLGRIPPNDDLEIPDRHLGLHMGGEASLPEDALDAAAEHVRTERLVDLSSAPARPPTDDVAVTHANRDPTVAVAQDAAFCFYYPATIERLRERADVVTFAPTAGDDLPDCDGVYLPGGYPELHAADLAASPALSTLADRAADGLPILGECGGLMALTRSLEPAGDDADSHDMAGILPADVSMHDRYQALDHVELEARDDALTADAGETLRGHEFHYSSADVDRDARFAFDVVRGDGIDDERDGLTEYSTLGTYAHVHPESGAFDAFIERL
ncbi:cobyrinic acid a,c-diamide synthase [Halostella pelagica]|uniref:cobyrinic acid a,c-diamide synthase n=1 Tax=Halostella pelagica TaxID=2583824 RepID=UPI0010815095|nr:cobyrinic acid a,c-diamide synthase [Halostella pelagica]